MRELVTQIRQRGLSSVAQRAAQLGFRHSSEYWSQRYRWGGDSGAGSYGRLAAFKAEVLNDLVEKEGFSSVIELGCGDGNQLELMRYKSYIGLDTATGAIERCLSRFQDDPTKSFFLYDSRRFRDNHRLFHADVALSLDVLYHLVEDDVYDSYLRHLFAAADKMVVIYSSDDDELPRTRHVRHRRFTTWVDEHATGWQFRNRIPNRHPYRPGDPDTSRADFFLYTPRT